MNHYKSLFYASLLVMIIEVFLAVRDKELDHIMYAIHSLESSLWLIMSTYFYGKYKETKGKNNE